MTTIAFRDGVMAADSRITEDWGTTRGQKLFRIEQGKKSHLIGVAGDLFAARVFVDWYPAGDDKELHRTLTGMDDDFTALVWTGSDLLEFNRYCRPIAIEEPYYAIGSGAPHAITALDCGKTAVQAVRLASRRDSSTGGRVVAMEIK